MASWNMSGDSCSTSGFKLDILRSVGDAYMETTVDTKELWELVEKVGEVNGLDYGAMVTLGSVFSQMESALENSLDKKKLLDFMTSRFVALREQSIKDFTGDMQSRVHELREVKYWKEAIERGEFDTGIGGELQEIYLILSLTEPQIVDYTFYKDVEIVRERVKRLNEGLPKQEYWFITLYENARKSVDSGTEKLVQESDKVDEKTSEQTRYAWF